MAAERRPGRPQPKLPLALAAARRSRRPSILRATTTLRARGQSRRTSDPARAPADHDLVPPTAGTRGPLRREPARRAEVRPARRPPDTNAPTLPRKRSQLGELTAARHHGIRRRAATRTAQQHRRRPLYERRAHARQSQNLAMTRAVSRIRPPAGAAGDKAACRGCRSRRVSACATPAHPRGMRTREALVVPDHVRDRNVEAASQPEHQPQARRQLPAGAHHLRIVVAHLNSIPIAIEVSRTVWRHITPRGTSW